jgi:hypothetical protein
VLGTTKHMCYLSQSRTNLLNSDIHNTNMYHATTSNCTSSHLNHNNTTKCMRTHKEIYYRAKTEMSSTKIDLSPTGESFSKRISAVPLPLA